ncbi:NADPH:quinone reductase [Hymenobacter terrenus]|uniref:NADPH:quinone reductase n=1 Tax=Hymenobacter terrenus TaxID=1629124 RepID=UPI000619D222|nr:NADPH:quinone reductase [Hymenobacter terrenus]
MKSIRINAFGGPKVLQWEKVPDLTPQSGQILIRIRAAGLNPADVLCRGGGNPAQSLPYTPGTEEAGIVEELGGGVYQFKVGDRVYLSGAITGTCAEMALCEPMQVHLLPRHISFAQGAGISVAYGTAFRSLIQRAHARAGESVFIHGGSGGVGIAAVQLARAHGLEVTATSSTPEGRELVRAQGAHHVLDHTAAGYLDQARELTAGQGFDVILEMKADLNLAHDLHLIRRRGRIVVIGASGGALEINSLDIMHSEVIILGVVLSPSKAEAAQMVAAIDAGLASGVLQPVVGREFPLADAAQAHTHAAQARGFGRIVLVNPGS